MFRCDAGNVALYVALMIPVFVAAAGLAIDATTWYTTKRSTQNGVDAAAYAAALSLASQGLANSPDLSDVQAAADDAAFRNGLATPVTVNLPPVGGMRAGDSSSVEVTASSTGRMPFSSMFLTAAPSIPARAVARAVVADACVWALHPTERATMKVSGTSTVELGCGVVVNSDHPEAALQQTGSSCLTATAITVRGGFSGNCVTPEPETLSPDYGDPLDHLLEPSYGACDFPNKVTVSASMAAGYPGGVVPLSPGVYCDGIKINANQQVEFAPGLYVLEGGEFSVAGNATVTNTENAAGGVTFFLTGSGSDYATLSFTSGANITLTPMTSGALANVLFYQDPDAPANGSNKVAGGVTMDLTGILYFPSQHVLFTGGSTAAGSDVLLVASTVEFSGNSTINASYAQNVLPQVYYARLVE